MSTTRKMKFSFLAVAALALKENKIMMSKFGLTSVSTLLILAVLAACGGGSGGGGGDTTTTTATAAVVPRFAYVANYNDNTVSIYSVNAATGQLRHNGYVAAGTNPVSVTVDPTGKFAYVANFGGGVSAYTINAGTGALTQIDAIPGFGGIDNFPAGTNPRSVTVDPTGKFAYVANVVTNNVWVYNITTTSFMFGALIPADIVAAETGPRSITVDPSGKFAYVANQDSDNVSAYSLDATTGAMTSIGTVAAETGPQSIVTTGTIQ